MPTNAEVKALEGVLVSKASKAAPVAKAPPLPAKVAAAAAAADTRSHKHTIQMRHAMQMRAAGAEAERLPVGTRAGGRRRKRVHPSR